MSSCFSPSVLMSKDYMDLEDIKRIGNCMNLFIKILGKEITDR